MSPLICAIALLSATNAMCPREVYSRWREIRAESQRQTDRLTQETEELRQRRSEIDARTAMLKARGLALEIQLKQIIKDHEAQKMAESSKRPLRKL